MRDIVNKREETLNFSVGERVTVGTVLAVLSHEYGKAFIDYLYDSETKKPKGFLQFLVNGNSTSTLNGLDTELNNGDVLAILPPVGGG